MWLRQFAADCQLPRPVAVAALRVERALCQQLFHQQQMTYRSFKAQLLSEDAETEVPSNVTARLTVGSEHRESNKHTTTTPAADTCTAQSHLWH